mgnify:CR=1 FL=1
MMKERVPSAERLLDILLLFRTHPEGIAARTLMTELGLSRSSAFRHLQTLKAMRFVEPGGRSGEFVLGPTVEELALIRASHRSLPALARPAMERLAEATGESVLLSRRSGDRVLVIASVESSRVLRVSIAAAEGAPLHQGSFGKLHLALLDGAERDRVLKRLAADGGIADVAAFRAELAQIRRSGHAFSDGEIEVGMSSLSVPVSVEGNPIAALSIAGPVFRITQAPVSALVRQLAAAAEEIAAELRRVGSGDSGRQGIRGAR